MAGERPIVRLLGGETSSDRRPTLWVGDPARQVAVSDHGRRALTVLALPRVLQHGTPPTVLPPSTWSSTELGEQVGRSRQTAWRDLQELQTSFDEANLREHLIADNAGYSLENVRVDVVELLGAREDPEQLVAVQRDLIEHGGLYLLEEHAARLSDQAAAELERLLEQTRDLAAQRAGSLGVEARPPGPAPSGEPPRPAEGARMPSESAVDEESSAEDPATAVSIPQAAPDQAGDDDDDATSAGQRARTLVVGAVATFVVIVVGVAIGTLLAGGSGADERADASTPNGVYETTGGIANTWTDRMTGGGERGEQLDAGQTVVVACRAKGLRVQNGNEWWYKLASKPYNGRYWVSADAFFNNGRTTGDFTKSALVDKHVPICQDGA